MTSQARPNPQVVKAKRAEIALRYARATRKFGPVSFAAIRLSELTRLFQCRHRGNLPADDYGKTSARIAVHHIARLRDAARRMDRWLEFWTPWLDLASRERLINEATEHPMRWKADKIAWKLRVTPAERKSLNLKTIGAQGETAAQRKASARARRIARERKRRAGGGATTRTAYLAASISQAKPWIACKMSRTAWYAAGKPNP